MPLPPLPLLTKEGKRTTLGPRLRRSRTRSGASIPAFARFQNNQSRIDESPGAVKLKNFGLRASLIWATAEGALRGLDGDAGGPLPPLPLLTKEGKNSGMRWRGYDYLYLPYPLLTKEGKRTTLDPRLQMSRIVKVQSFVDTFRFFFSSPLKDNPLNPPYQGDGRTPLPPDKGVYRPETWWTGVQGHGGHSVGYSAGWRKSSSLIYW